MHCFLKLEFGIVGVRAEIQVWLDYSCCCWVEILSYLYMSAGGMSECSVALDDSVSEEEEECSFDELTDVTPYLQPGVEPSVLNQVKQRRAACGHKAAFSEAKPVKPKLQQF